jgi:hypothetical protein
MISSVKLLNADSMRVVRQEISCIAAAQKVQVQKQHLVLGKHQSLVYVLGPVLVALNFYLLVKSLFRHFCCDNVSDNNYSYEYKERNR